MSSDGRTRLELADAAWLGVRLAESNPSLLERVTDALERALESHRRRNQKK